MLFCKIGVRNSETGEWIWKSDTGSSGGFEEEKSLASDAFKRAAVSWGIGRELYSVPSIHVDLNAKDFYQNEFKQTFKVKDILIENCQIMSLEIVDKWGNPRYSYNRNTNQVSKGQSSEETSTPSRKDVFTRFCSKMKEQGEDKNELTKFYNYFMKPTTRDPKKSVLDVWKNPVHEKMWDWWINGVKTKST